MFITFGNTFITFDCQYAQEISLVNEINVTLSPGVNACEKILTSPLITLFGLTRSGQLLHKSKGQYACFVGMLRKTQQVNEKPL